MTLREVEHLLGRSRPDLPVAEVLVALFEEYTGPDVAFFPGEVVRALSNIRYSSESVCETLRLLAGPPFRVLDRRQRFVDESGDKIDFSPSDLTGVRAAGEFRHPHTGVRVADWETRIEDWYGSGPALDEAFSTAQ